MYVCNYVYVCVCKISELEYHIYVYVYVCMYVCMYCLYVRISISVCMRRFDPNGTQLLDYSALTRQVYGDDITTEKLVLPRLKDHTKKFNAMADTLNTNTYGSTIAPDHSRLHDIHCMVVVMYVCMYA